MQPITATHLDSTPPPPQPITTTHLHTITPHQPLNSSATHLRTTTPPQPLNPSSSNLRNPPKPTPTSATHLLNPESLLLKPPQPIQFNSTSRATSPLKPPISSFLLNSFGPGSLNSSGPGSLNSSPSLLSQLEPKITHLILSSREIPTQSCISFFNFLKHNSSSLVSHKTRPQSTNFAAKEIMSVAVAEEELGCSAVSAG